MHRWLFAVVMFAGCAPSNDPFLGQLTEDGGGPALGDGAFRDHGLALFSMPLAEGMSLQSDAPDVLRPVSVGEITDETPDGLDASDTLVADPEHGVSGAWFESGGPGFAVLSIVDDATGEELDAVEVEVRTAEGTALVPTGGWTVPCGAVPRVLAGVDYGFDLHALDGDGRPLVGQATEDGLLAPPATFEAREPGLQTFRGAAIEVVDRADLVSIDLEPSSGPLGWSGLVAVGRDRHGAAVLGVPATWDGPVSDPQDRGDVLAFQEDLDADAVSVSAVFEGLEATDLVRTSVPAQVEHTGRSFGCSSTGAPAGLLLGLLAPLAIRRRR